MNEITRIHLAKTPYNIEVAAYGALRAYLDGIEKALHADTDAMREIESRMTELLDERGVNGESVITSADVEALQKQLGDPKDFAGDDTEQTSSETAPKKRLMRDTSNAMLGGVCSGVAAYFGWDVVWVRIAAVILTFITSGTMILIYIILAIVMPEAKTASNRLEMTGTPVTLGNLKDTAIKTAEAIEPMLAKVLRISAGILLTIGAFLSAMTVMSVVGYIVIHFNDISYFYNGHLDSGVSIGLMALGGVMLTVLCTLLAKMVFLRKATKNAIMASIIVALLGAASFGSGAAITALRVHDFQQVLSTSDVTKPLDVKGQFDGIKAIDVRSRGINLHYTVSDTSQKGSYAYNSFLVKKPSVSLTKLGDTLVVQDSFDQSEWCSRAFVSCNMLSVDVYLSGPTLEHLTTNGFNTSYAAIQQDNLVVEQKEATDFTLTSVGMIKILQLTTEDGNLTANDAIIGTVNVTGSRGRINLATVSALNITTNITSCSTPFVINGTNLGAVKVNGQDWNLSNESSCLVMPTNG